MPGNLVLLLIAGRRRQLFAPGWERAAANLLVWAVLVYLGWSAGSWGQRPPARKPESAFNLIFWVWVIMLVPWLLFGPMSAIAFDGGYTISAYVFVGSTWTYPISVLIMALFRRRVGWIVLLPFVNVTGCFTADLFR